MRYKQARRKQKGGLLLDATIGICLLAILGLLFAGSLTAAVSVRGATDERTKAIWAANREIEALENLGYANMTYSGLVFYNLIEPETTTSPYVFTSIGNTSDRISTLLPSGTGSITVTDISSTVREVTVTVSWVARSGSRSISLSTRMADMK